VGPTPSVGHTAKAAKGMTKVRFEFKWLSASFAFVFPSFAILCLYGAGFADVTTKVVFLVLLSRTILQERFTTKFMKKLYGPDEVRSFVIEER
jgi:hypothetical protein